jgi:hypothetical protein
MSCTLARRSRGPSAVWTQYLVDLLAAAHHRIERGHRFLEDHRHAGAAQLAQALLARAEDVLALQQDRPRPL